MPKPTILRMVPMPSFPVPFPSVSLNPKPTILHKPNTPLSTTPSPGPFSSIHFHIKPLPCCSSSRDEPSLWLREEQRWLREEQRWLREEKRWARERDSLLREISQLKLQIQALERQLSSRLAPTASSLVLPDAIGNATALLQVLKEKSNLIPDRGTRVKPIERVIGEEEQVEKGAVTEEKDKVVRALEKNEVKQRSTLRIGSEGADVQALQEALLNLGFYSGEEGMEYSSFSSGTERAVKTWQAASGTVEDGIMTAELLERLYMEVRVKDTHNADQKEPLTRSSKEGATGAIVATMTELSEIQQTVAKDGGKEVSQPRVYLLGENRWEDPSRLFGRERLVDKNSSKGTNTQCQTCRGEGRLLCMECDGTGEPNVEPQFLELVGEGAKCPYCEGVGYSVCDVCAGKTTV